MNMHWILYVGMVASAIIGISVSIVLGPFASGLWTGGCYMLGYLFALAFAQRTPKRRANRRERPRGQRPTRYFERPG